jgi:hypothetical protein
VGVRWDFWFKVGVVLDDERTHAVQPDGHGGNYGDDLDTWSYTPATSHEWTHKNTPQYQAFSDHLPSSWTWRDTFCIHEPCTCNPKKPSQSQQQNHDGVMLGNQIMSTHGAIWNEPQTNRPRLNLYLLGQEKNTLLVSCINTTLCSVLINKEWHSILFIYTFLSLKIAELQLWTCQSPQTPFLSVAVTYVFTWTTSPWNYGNFFIQVNYSINLSAHK